MTPSIATVIGAIRSQVNSTLTLAGLSVHHDNQYDASIPGNVLWAYVAVLISEGVQIDNGGPNNRRFRYSGIVQTSLFEPNETGTSASEAIVDILINLLNGTKINAAQFRTTYPEVIGRLENTRWFQTNVISPFFFDTIG